MVFRGQVGSRSVASGPSDCLVKSLVVEVVDVVDDQVDSSYVSAGSSGGPVEPLDVEVADVVEGKDGTTLNSVV